MNQEMFVLKLAEELLDEMILDHKLPSQIDEQLILATSSLKNIRNMFALLEDAPTLMPLTSKAA